MSRQQCYHRGMARGWDARVDIGDVTLVWGNASEAKAALRDESLRRHLERPIGERLRIALSMVLPRRDREPDDA